MKSQSRLTTFSPRQGSQASPQLIKYLNSVEQTLAKQIETGQFTIGDHQQDVCDPVKLKQRAYQSRIQEIKDLKLQMIQKIHQLNSEQKILKKNSPMKKIKKYERSFFTEQDKLRVSNVLKAKQQHQKSINQKIQTIMDQIFIKQKQLDDEKKDIMQRRKKQRVTKLFQKRHKTQHMKNSLINSLQKSTKGLNKKNYSYFKNIQKDEQLKKQRDKYYSVILREKRQRNRMDFHKIKQHSMEHDFVMEQKKKEYQLQVQMQMRSRIKSQISVPETEFMKKVKEQKLLTIEQKRREQIKKKELREKIVNYQNQVKINFKPKIDDKSRFVLPEEKKIISPSPRQRLEKGKQYLAEAKKKIKKISPDEKEDLMFAKRIGHISEKYPNYITDIKEQNQKKTAQNLGHLLQEKKFNTLKAQKAIRWVKNREEQDRLLTKKKNHQIDSEFQSVRDKMKILSSLLTLDA